LVILSETAEETGKSIDEVQDETNESMENPATTDDGQDQTVEEPLPNKADEESFSMLELNSREYEIFGKSK